MCGSFVGAGFNLVENTTGAAIGGTGNIFGVAPLLAPLSFNGGATRTHALLNGSPAIDAGDPTTFPATDQRGVTRPQDGDGPGEIYRNPLTGNVNIMYRFHFYAKTHRVNYLNALDEASERLPIFVTEWGSQEASRNGNNDFAKEPADDFPIN